MKLETLETIVAKKKRRLGLGHGSGRGKTAGRGTKGQKARTKVALSFEGGALPLIKRLPFLRGKGRNSVREQSPLIVTLTALNTLPAKTIVDIETLVQHGVVSVKALERGVKILGTGDVKNVYTIKVPVSKTASELIQKAGGTIAAE